MKAREMERKMSRQTRLLKAPDRWEADQQVRTASRAAAAANQSPHTEAVLVPERSNRRTTCPRIRSAAAASADARDFNIAGTGPPRLASNQTLLHRLVLRLEYTTSSEAFPLALLYCAEAKDASCALVWIAIFSGGNAALHDERAVCHIPWRRSQAAAHPADRWIIDRRIMDRRIIDRRIMDRRITQPILSWEHAAPEHSRAAR